MRNLFRSYHRPTDEEFRVLWDKGTFVFDANVLLDLYSYPESVRNEFFPVLERISDRLWIPYQAALEYQRNRINRIKQLARDVRKLSEAIEDAKGRIPSEVARIELEKRDIGIDDLDKRIDAVKVAHERLSEAVNNVISKLPIVSLDDPIRDRLETLFKDRVGQPPTDQSQLNEYISEADKRYAKEIPPGYKDSAKRGQKYMDRGLEYDAHAGDFILWSQVLSHIRDVKLTHVIFVTADEKDDWWTIEDGRTLGPRPELAQEALSATGDGGFWIYTPAQFLRFAKQFLQIPVTDAVIDRVKEVTNRQEPVITKLSDLAFIGRAAADALEAQAAGKQWTVSSYALERAVREFLELTVCPDKIETASFPDLITTKDGKLWGYEIVTLTRPAIVNKQQTRFLRALARGSEIVAAGSLSGFTLFIVMDAAGRSTLTDDVSLKPIRNLLKRAVVLFPATSIWFGALIEGRFVPILQTQSTKHGPDT